MQGDLPRWLLKLHEEYNSDVVRVTPTELSFINAAMWKDVYVRKPGRPNYEKNRLVYPPPPDEVHSMLTASNPDHSRMRRVFDPSFAAKALRVLESKIEDYAQKLIEFLRQEVSTVEAKAQDLTKWYNWMSFDLTGDITFGQSFNCLDDKRYHPWVGAITGNIQGLALLGACGRFPLLKSLLPYLLPPSVKEMVRRHNQFFSEAYEKRISAHEKKADVMATALEVNADGKGLSPKELESNAQLFIIAGSDSNASLLSGATYYLLKHPSALAKLTREVDSAFAKDEDLTVQSVSQLPYLQAVLNETMRMYPAAHIGQASIVPLGGDVICGYQVPAEVCVC